MQDSVSFVCCVEAGWLEAQTVRLVESLRQFGGQYSTCPIFAVKPRFGPALSEETIRIFKQLDVTYLQDRSPNPYSWFRFFNKPRAILAADKICTSEILCWLDSDMIILSEPDAFDFSRIDFVACASDKEMGTSVEGDPYTPLWRALCAAAGLSLEDLPVVTTEMEQIPIRCYWNSGFFAFRRSTGFARQFMDHCERLLLARVKTSAPGYSPGINEMGALGLAMVNGKMPFRALPVTYNYPMARNTPENWYSAERLTQVKILHYHDCMWPEYWPILLARIESTHPRVAQWLGPLGPMTSPSGPIKKLVSRVLNEIRRAQEARYLSSCRIV